MQKRNVLNSPRLLELKKNRHKAIFNKVLISCLGLFVIFILFTYLSGLESLNLGEIKIVGNKVLSTEEIEKVVKDQLSGKYIWLFPKTNIFFYPKNSIRNELEDKFKRVKDINFSIKNNEILEVSLSERIGKYTWCGHIKETELEECYFLDEDGYIFDKAPYFSGEVYFKFYGEVGDILGSYFFRENFKQLISFKDILFGIEIKPVALYVKDGGDIEVFLSKGKEAETEPKIIFKINSIFQNIAENLKTALNTEPLQSEFKNKYSSLLYLDLRFENKVYSKFK
ncbi:MAG: hypothetical protein WC884_00885 [Candidatus Paceibacterota bacterium]